MSHLKRSASTGHLLRNESGHLVFTCDEPGDPCQPPCSELASAYTVLGVGGLVGCGACLGSNQPAWNGVLEQVDDLCQWNLNVLASIGGKLPSYALAVSAACPGEEISNAVGIVFSTIACRWELAITCRTTAGYPVIWAGAKDPEAGPAGVYTRVCGCDETPTLTVV